MTITVFPELRETRTVSGFWELSLGTRSERPFVGDAITRVTFESDTFIPFEVVPSVLVRMSKVMSFPCQRPASRSVGTTTAASTRGRKNRVDIWPLVREGWRCRFRVDLMDYTRTTIRPE